MVSIMLMLNAYLLGNALGEHVAAMLILAMLMIDSVHWGGIGYAGE
jgi:hypothetical protein